MRYFSYDEPTFDGHETVTMSEDDIRRTYYPYWEAAMIKKYGEEKFEETYSFNDCLDDWVVIHWAREVTE